MKFGIREICNVVLKAKKAGKVLGIDAVAGQPILWFDSLKTSGLEGTGETVYARGGRGNAKLIAWEGDKEVTFTMEDALLSPLSLALLVGANEVKTATTGLTKHIMEEVNVVGGTPDYTYTPVGTPYICDPQDPSISLETAEGYSTVFVDYYTNVSATEGTGAFVAKQMTQVDISPEAFGVNFYLEGETLFRDKDGVDHAAEIIIPQCRVQSNFSFNMSSSGDPSTFTFTMDAIPDKIIGGSKKVICAIQITDDDEDIETTNVMDDGEEE